MWSWSPLLWCGTPCLTATFPHGLVQSRRRIRSRGRRWRVASYQRKVVEMDPFQPPPEGPRRAGGDPAPGNVATTRLPGAGVREHPAPLGALRPEDPEDDAGRGEVREHPAPLGALRRTPPRTRRDVDEVREHPAPLGALRPPRPGASTRGHGRSGTTPCLCVTSSPPHGWAAVIGSKGSNRPGPSPLAATAHRGTFCAERDVLRTK